MLILDIKLYFVGTKIFSQNKMTKDNNIFE